MRVCALGLPVASYNGLMALSFAWLNRVKFCKETQNQIRTINSLYMSLLVRRVSF